MSFESIDAQTVELLLSPFFLAVLGLLVGSFLNVVIHRIPLMMDRAWKIESAEVLGLTIEEPAPITLALPRSRCPSCGHKITWYENIPVLSYLWMRGRCSACKTHISARYPAIELATGLLFGACGWQFGAHPATLLWCGLAATLIALAFIDLDTQFLPDSLTLPLLWAGITASALGWTPVPLKASIWGAIAGYMSLWFVYHAYLLIRKQEGLGQGDFKLLAALGAWMGWQLIPSIILLSSAVGAVVGIAMITLRGHDRSVPIPFGPYLAGGGIVAIFFGAHLSRLWFPA